MAKHRCFLYALYFWSRRSGSLSASRRYGSPSSRVHISSTTVILPSFWALQASGDAGIAVGHMGRSLLVHRGDEANAGGRKQVERIHVGRADDAEYLGDALRDRRLDERLGTRHARA